MSHSEAPEHFEGPWWKYPVLRNAIAAGILAGSAFALSRLGFIPEALELALYLAAIPVGAYHWAREAIEELMHERQVGIDALMLSALVGSAALGLWDEAAALAVLYAAAEGLEEYTYARARSAIRSLLDLAPKEASVLRNGKEERIPAQQLAVGDVFLVRPGESFATDGAIRRGASSVDEAAVTGESVPVDKGQGDQVFAGTLNRQGALEVEATATFADNTLAKVIHLVEEAQEQKGRAQQWIERFGRRYSPAVLLTSLGMILLPALFGALTHGWVNRAVVLLVAAAPCALVMSMPVAMAAGIGRAGKRGILIKGGAHLEHLGRVSAVAFDKTGTLTEGEPKVSDVVPISSTNDEALALAAAVERCSEHPLAKAIVAEAAERGLPICTAERFQALTGAGAEAFIEGKRYTIGNPEYLRASGVSLARAEQTVAQLEESGKTVVLLSCEGELIACIALRDRLRPGVPEVVRRLRERSLHVAMLTGDNERTARVVAREAGIDDVRAALKPADKVRIIQEFVARFPGGVLMVGDGINDAPALAAATCGVSMGAAGSDAAIEAADVALMADDLAKVEEALVLGRRVQKISRQNIAFSLLLLASLIPSALFGFLSIAGAVFAHELGELIAVANGLRARS